MLNSRSWRVTLPLRLTVAGLRRVKLAIKEGRLLSGINRRIKPGLQRPVTVIQNPHDLSPRATRIYAELKKAIELEKPQESRKNNNNP